MKLVGKILFCGLILIMGCVMVGIWPKALGLDEKERPTAQKPPFVFFNGIEASGEDVAALIDNIEEALHEKVLLVELMGEANFDPEQRILVTSMRADVVLVHRSAVRNRGTVQVGQYDPESKDAGHTIALALGAAMEQAIANAIDELQDMPQKPPAPTIDEIHMVLNDHELVITQDDVAARIKMAAFLQTCDLVDIEHVNSLTTIARDEWDEENKVYTTAAHCTLDAGEGHDVMCYQMEEEPSSEEKVLLIETVQMHALKLAIEDLLEKQKEGKR